MNTLKNMLTNMNLPNKLTILRVILIVPFVVFMLLTEKTDWSKWIALILFCAASITDALDGHIARRDNLVTNFGKFMDPLADKLLVCSALVCLVSLRMLPTVVCIIIIAREFAISGFRLVAADNGIVIAAGIWGKLKTISQMAMIILLIADLGSAWGVFHVIENILIFVSTALTLISLADYIWKNKEVLNMQE